MPSLVLALQAISGLLWLALAIYSLPRIAGAWRSNASKITIVSARNGMLAWLMAGFSVRWLVWRDAVHVMAPAEIACWAALYAMSALCAVWFFTGAIQNRGR